MLLLTTILLWSVIFADGVTTGPTNSYISVMGKSLPGPMTPGSVKFVRNLTLNQCAAECSLEYHLNKFPCYAFQYSTVHKLCFLSNVTTLLLKGGYLALRHNPSMMYFERPKGSYLNLFQPFPNKVLKQQQSYFAVFYNKTLEKCAMFCLLESRDTCMAFSYSPQKQVCGLSKVFFEEGNGQSLISSGNYNHYQYFTTWPCNATIPWNYSPRAIASPYFPYASLTDVNCFLKIEAPEGKQVDLTFSTFFTQGDLCQSQHHGVTIIDGPSPNDAELSRLCSSDNFVNRRFLSSAGNLYLTFSSGSTAFAFKAVYEFKTVDVCADSPCMNNGTCVSSSGHFSCTCRAGYTGSRCEVDIDECSSSPCFFGGHCVELVNDFRCECQNLFGGKRCDKFVGLCYLDPCQNGGTCSHRGIDSYVCDCPRGFTDKNCTTQVQDPCKTKPCLNGATCIPIMDAGTRTCACAQGFTGSNCETDIDECASGPCLHNIPCTDLVNDFRCECPLFMSGKICENFIGHCYDNECIHGTCRPTGRDNYTCDCNAGYIGSKCDVLFIDYCQPDPCRHGKCSSFDNGPVCKCNVGFSGIFCDHKIDFCKGINCNQGECVNEDDGFTCNCIQGYEGKFCNEIINYCKKADCHGGYCINTISSHFCVCKNGRTGLDCAMSTTHFPSYSGSIMTNLTSAAHTTNKPPCSVKCNHGVCDQDFSNVCVCQNGFSGQYCDIFEGCEQGNPCHYGNCTDEQNNNYKCTCESGYTGPNCETNIRDVQCSDKPCHNGGVCLDLVPGVSCICPTGYRGDRCEEENACSRDPCITGQCIPTGNSFVCRTHPIIGKGNTSLFGLPGWVSDFVSAGLYSPLSDDNRISPNAIKHVDYSATEDRRVFFKQILQDKSGR